jgi:alanyl-tRNA synthetase
LPSKCCKPVSSAGNLPVHFEILDIDEAKRRGAIGLFEDKYAALGNKINVYFIGDQPIERGGTPVSPASC